jgi:hypothetical protein
MAKNIPHQNPAPVEAVFPYKAVFVLFANDAISSAKMIITHVIIANARIMEIRNGHVNLQATSYSDLA